MQVKSIAECSPDILPISRGRISAPFPIENSHTFFPNTMSDFPNKKRKLFFFFTFFRDHYYLWETITHIRMMFKCLCLSGMFGIIQSKITWFWGYILLPLCFVSLISLNFDFKSIIFSQFWSGAFSQNCWKKPWPLKTGFTVLLPCWPSSLPSWQWLWQGYVFCWKIYHHQTQLGLHATKPVFGVSRESDLQTSLLSYWD